MSLIEVYTQLPSWPDYVSIDLAFSGQNQIFEGLLNTAINLSQLSPDDFEVIEAINVGRVRMSIFNLYTGIPVGDFYTYKTFDYPNQVRISILDAYTAVYNWDVYQHYIRQDPDMSYGTSRLRSSGAEVRSLENFENGIYDKFLSGDYYDWEWGDYRASNDDYPDNTVPDDFIIVFELKTFPTVIRYKKPPNYYDLLRGYTTDERTILSNPLIVPSISCDLEIEYYRENRLEPIPDLRSIDIRKYKIKAIEGIALELPIIDCTLGTLSVSNEIIKSDLIGALIPNNKYPSKYYFREYLPELFTTWRNLTGISLNAPPPTDRTIRIIGANNDAWNNRSNPTNDLNVDTNHPMFVIDNTRAYNWHIAPQSEGIGTLIMDSPRTIETRAMLDRLFTALQIENYQTEDLTSNPPLHHLDWYIKNSSGEKLDKVYKALGAELWGTNPDSPDVARVDNLGWRLRRLCEVLGIRVKTDGTIDEELEKTTNRRLHADGTETNNPQEYNPNGFGSKGLLVRYLPNKFARNGTTSGGYRKVKDIPQLIAEMHEQANAAMGYQEGTAIEINLDGKTYRYPNQLALMIELFVTAKQTATYSKGAFFSSLIGEQSIKEVMAGLGLRTVDKYLEFSVAGKVTKLYYKGISASQSLRRKLSAIATDIGTVIGNII